MIFKHIVVLYVYQANLCFIGLWYNWRTVPQDTTESCPGTIPFGKSTVSFFHISLSEGCLCWRRCVFFLNSGCSCLTPSSAHSWCCHHQHMWTTELRASVIEISSRSAMCALFVCQVSLIPSQNTHTWLFAAVKSLFSCSSLVVFCNFSPICTTCE